MVVPRAGCATQAREQYEVSCGRASNAVAEASQREAELLAEEERLHATLPDFIQKLTGGYACRVAAS